MASFDQIYQQKAPGAPSLRQTLLNWALLIQPVELEHYLTS